MKVIKYIAVFIIFCLVLTIIFDAFDRLKNNEAYETKNKIIEAVNLGLNKNEPVKLEDIGGINWEQICFISYEINGYDAARGLDIPVKYLGIPKSKFSQIADETYTEFKGSEYGLVFWSIKREIFVAIPLENVTKVPASECHDAQNLMLLNRIKPEGRTLILSTQ